MTSKHMMPHTSKSKKNSKAKPDELQQNQQQLQQNQQIQQPNLQQWITDNEQQLRILQQQPDHPQIQQWIKDSQPQLQQIQRIQNQKLQQVALQGLQLVPFPVPCLNPATFAVTKEQSIECDTNLRDIQIEENNLKEFCLQRATAATKVTSYEELKPMFDEVVQKVVNESTPLVLEKAGLSRAMVQQIINVTNSLSQQNESMAKDFVTLQNVMQTLQSELKQNKDQTVHLQSEIVTVKIEADSLKEQTVQLQTEIDNVKQDKIEADGKISVLEEKVTNLTTQLADATELLALAVSDEEKAKLLIRQVMTTVPALLAKFMFPGKDLRPSMSYRISEVEKMVQKIQDTKENSEKSAILDELMGEDKLGCTRKEMEEFITEFKDRCGNQAAHPKIESQQHIQKAIDLLVTKCEIDPDEEVPKVNAIGNLWDILTKLLDKKQNNLVKQLQTNTSLEANHVNHIELDNL